ncbi:YbaB/EbfC family nucleoid-associated protein [Candidatus Saganbacteria bacterium]|nr:YbaB/EbfC family nucleoid-associated protein [Candidatus Saganbacteria bacterium]
MGFPNLGNMGEMIKMAREMQGQLKKVKEELAREMFESTNQGITFKINGDLEIKEVKIDPKMADPQNVGRLERAVMEAAKNALKSAKDGAARKMKGITGGLGLPPGML